MKCPKCGREGMKYNISRKKLWKKSNQGTATSDPRKDFKAKCSKCKWEGEMK